MPTFETLSLDGLHRHIQVVVLVVPLEHVSELPGAYLPLQDEVINYLRHPRWEFNYIIFKSWIIRECLGILVDNRMLVNRVIRFWNSNIAKIDPRHIRNFCIIAHIDHGKSTLADRFLEITNTISRDSVSQYLDKLKVEKERGITVKAQAVSMYYTYKDIKYLINLIDTPGHVDFSYEVKRSMRTCQGALLLVDATQGIQAQTLTNYDFAREEKLKILPALNKIDVEISDLKEVKESICNELKFKMEDLIGVSAKTGENVENLLQIIIDSVPPPENNTDSKLKFFLINSSFVKSKGVVLLVQVKSGELKKGITIASCATGKSYQVFEVGILHPEETPQASLTVGQVGYVYCNMKEVSEGRIGDTFFKVGQKVEAEKGFQPAKPMVYAGIYPMDPNDYPMLQKNIYKLLLTDPAVSIIKQSSSALGSGFKCGFLGVLHMDVFKQRLDDEYQIQTILTSPSVPYKCNLRTGKVIFVNSAAEAPDRGLVSYYQEPMAKGNLVFPKQFLRAMTDLIMSHRGKVVEQVLIENKKYILKIRIPLSQIITDYMDSIKSMTHGYGSFEYDLDGFQKADVDKLVIHLMNDPIDALSFMVHKSRAFDFGKQICKKLKQQIPQQLFVVSIQARIGGKIIAKEDIAHTKRHVTSKCYGGDYSRKQKLIDRYKEGKKKLREIGKVQVGKETFLHLFKNQNIS